MNKRRHRRRHHAGATQSRERPQTTEASAPAAKSQGLVPARVFLLLSSVIAVYLAWVSFKGGSLPGCGPESGCDKVLQSRWSHWLGIPVAVPAAIVYLTLLWTTFQIGGRASEARRRNCSLAMVALSVVILGAAVWFVGLQALVIKSFCAFCLTAHASAAVAAGLLLRNVASRTGASGTDRFHWPPKTLGIRRSEVIKFAFAGVGALLVLLAGQALVAKKTYAVKRMEGAAAPSTNASAQTAGQESGQPSGSTETRTVSVQPISGSAPSIPAQPSGTAGPNATPTNPAPSARREIVLHQGKHRLAVDELPIIGLPSAPHLTVSLFDYTCHYCRDMHGLLLEAQRRFSNQLAIVSLPMPLDADCNHLVKRTSSAHANACQYAKFGLAVWRAKPEAFSEFDSWLFHPPSPLPLNDVRQRAEELVGRETLEQALADPWVTRQIQTAVALYESNSRELRDGRMPQLVIGSAISVGPLQNIDPLYTMLAEQLGLKP
ncbi:MAG: hypothetical protein FJ398_07120 [Verrucomicrobia bacterium]|nr:hypothetical protein [Verrucomicrobiota bacterium]